MLTSPDADLFSLGPAPWSSSDGDDDGDGISSYKDVCDIFLPVEENEIDFVFGPLSDPPASAQSCHVEGKPSTSRTPSWKAALEIAREAGQLAEDCSTLVEAYSSFESDSDIEAR